MALSAQECAEVTEALDEMSKSDGMVKIGKLMAAKFGGEPTEFVPYLMSVGLEVSACLMNGNLEVIKAALKEMLENGSEEVILRMLPIAMAVTGIDQSVEHWAKLAYYASLRVGIDRMADMEEAQWPNVLDFSEDDNKSN